MQNIAQVEILVWDPNKVSSYTLGEGEMYGLYMYVNVDI